MNVRVVVMSALALSGCFELSLPGTPPPPGPGTIQGTLKYSVPGRAGLIAAREGRVALLGSSLEARTDAEGRFVLAGITAPTGLVRFTADLDGDGAPDRQRLISIETIKAGPGRDVALGDVVLGRNGRLSGRVLRQDLGPDTFHLGTTVFIAGMEFTTFSADNGSWTLDGLPEGPLTVAFFRQNYLADARDVVLEAGEDKRLADVLLIPSPSEVATAAGLVTSASGPVAGARIRAVSFLGSAAATTNAEGRFQLGPVPSGAWVVGVEASGFVSAKLGQRLLLPGANDLGVITLAPGTSTVLSLDAGQAPPTPDGGAVLDAGAPDDAGVDAGTVDAGVDAGAPDAGVDAGPPDAGVDAGAPDAGVDAGAPDAGVDAGPVDAGAPLDCGGACSAGFFCSASVECQSTACGLQSCAAACNDGRCYGASCGATTTCGVGEVCDGVTCKPLACAGVACTSGTLCANGRCISQLCRYGSCGAGTVCVNAGCEDVRCVDVTCAPQHSCVGGVCLPTSSQTGTGCSPGFVFLGGRCVDQACQGLTCPAGSLCRNGQCNSTGLFVAGLTYPEGRTNLVPETVIATLTPTGWSRVNVTALPPVVQLVASADGQWLFALTDDVAGSLEEGSLWRSSDGVGWAKVFDGSNRAVTGVVGAVAVDFVTGAITIGVNGGPGNTFAGALRSVDQGSTWLRVMNGVGDGAGNRATVSGVSPALVVIPTSNNNTQNGLFPTDGGVRISNMYGPASTRLLYDPLGQGTPFVAAADLRFLDGGSAGPIGGTCADCAVYGPGDSVFVTSGTGVWFSANRGAAFSLRPLPTTPVLSLTGLVRGADDALVISNQNARPPLMTSSDEGLTWTQLGNDWFASSDLSDPVPAWQPDASYAFQQRVRPPVPNGIIYERWGSSTQSGVVEPPWTSDGGDVRDPQRDQVWRYIAPHLGMRVTAMVSLRCSSGQQRCGGACVDIATSAANCGGCGLVCAGTCRNGTCSVVDAGVVQPGCADGTREGFVDDVAWPNIAACQATWAGDLSAAADAVCGANFHVCTPADTELATVNFAQATAFPGCFAYRASNDGFDGCEPLECQGRPDRDDMAGMGRGCLLVSGVSRAPSTIPDGGTTCLADRSRIDAQCCAASVTIGGRSSGCRQRSEDGVVCCRD